MKRCLAGCLAFWFCALSQTQAKEVLSLGSPDGHIDFRLRTADGSLRYTVNFRKHEVIRDSPIRFSVDERELTKGFTLVDLKRYQVNETYPWRGVHSRATNHCNGAILSLKHSASGTDWKFEARAYDDGVALRFVAPGTNSSRVPDEETSFSLPEASTVWFHDLGGHYEGVHAEKPVEKVESGRWAAPPLTFKLPGGTGYASITEAALFNYSGMALQADGHDTFTLALAHKHPPSYPYRLRYSTDDIARLSKPAVIAGTIATPWRVVIIGQDLNALVNSDLLPNLCPLPDSKLFPQGIETSWIKPGRAVWKYMDGGDSSIEGTKEFCRLAGELGFEYNVIEGYWSRWTEEEQKDVVSYARQHGVGLWFWKHSKSLHTPEAREEFFAKLEKLGVVGAKIDFFDHEHKEVIDLYEACRADAARHHILVNFHGSNKPTGEARTWPNELTREAIKGMESSRITDRATHDATLPFTRYLAGPGDYTVMHFGQRRGNTTWAHQIATAMVFEMPLLTYVANPATILTNPAVDIIKSIPATWDETLVLPESEIGKLAVFARRSGKKWFLAAVNGAESRAVRIPLSFLPKGDHDALFVKDSDGLSQDRLRTSAATNSPSELKIERLNFKAGDTLKLQLPPGGGFVARFDK
jgi:alpha-glucosidase